MRKWFAIVVALCASGLYAQAPIWTEYGTISVMPDVYTLPASPTSVQFLRAPWTYFQGWSGIITKEGVLVLYGNGGGQQHGNYAVPGGQLPEEEWAIFYPQPHPLTGGKPMKYYDLARWQRLYWPQNGQDETGLISIIQTPPSWPDEHRWLLFGSCSNAGTWGKAYRVYIGIASAPSFPAPFVRSGEIQSVHELPVQPPPNQWWPQGVWCVAAFVVGERVIVIGRDNGVSASEAQKKRFHVIFEVFPDLTSRRVGTVVVEGATPQTWLTDAALGEDGHVLTLDGSDPGSITQRRPLAEFKSVEPWADGDVLVKATGRVFTAPGSTAMPAGPYTWDGGFVRWADGRLARNGVLANAGKSANPWVRGEWWMQWWTDDHDLAGTLGVEIEPVRLGPERDELR